MVTLRRHPSVGKNGASDTSHQNLSRECPQVGAGGALPVHVSTTRNALLVIDATYALTIELTQGRN